MTAAGSNAIYGSQYCGFGCGKCFKLTNTGYTPCKGCASPPCPELGCNVTLSDKAGQFVIVMVTNECPPGGNEQWCGQPKNEYGLAAHFDMAADNSDPVVAETGPNGWGKCY